MCVLTLRHSACSNLEMDLETYNLLYNRGAFPVHLIRESRSIHETQKNFNPVED